MYIHDTYIYTYKTRVYIYIQYNYIVQQLYSQLECGTLPSPISLRGAKYWEVRRNCASENLLWKWVGSIAIKPQNGWYGTVCINSG